MTGSDLKRWREQLGLTQDELAHRFDVTRNTVARYEALENIPKLIELAIKEIERQELESADFKVAHASQGNTSVLKLRDHPLMARKGGFITWPPRWTTANRDRDDKPIGEVGMLEDVTMGTRVDENKIFLFIVFRGFRYMGYLFIDNPPFYSEMFRLLKANVGRSIKEIGDLDLSYTL